MAVTCVVVWPTHERVQCAAQRILLSLTLHCTFAAGHAFTRASGMPFSNDYSRTRP